MDGVSRTSGNTYILAFLAILSTEIPGNFRKDGAQISTKNRNPGRHFSGKNLNFISRISGNTYILAFLHIVLITIPGNFRKGGAPIRRKFEIMVNIFFLGEVYLSTSRISLNTYIFTFLQVLTTSLHGHFIKGHCDFREN